MVKQRDLSDKGAVLTQPHKCMHAWRAIGMTQQNCILTSGPLVD